MMFKPFFAGRARHSVRAGLCQAHDGAHGVTRPTWLLCLFIALDFFSPQLSFAADSANVTSFLLNVSGNAAPGFTLMPPTPMGINFSNLVGSSRSSHTFIT